MREQLQTRLQELEQEYEKGQTMLRDTELQRAQLEQTLVRIEGAMTVLRELLEGGEGAPSNGAGEPEAVAAPAAPAP